MDPAPRVLVPDEHLELNTEGKSGESASSTTAETITVRTMMR
jgi:hypothetical protein